MPDVIFCLMGPTASGKTALACELAQHVPVEIISVDSAMIYRDMDIGTAKPDEHTLSICPHHLINILDPIESYSAALFCEDVDRLCKEIISRGKSPLLVGGTMMYFRALQQGLSVLPQADTKLRAQLLQQAQEHGWAHMHQKLAQVDAVMARRIHPNDTQRIQRALEVYELTKEPLSSFLQENSAVSTYRFVNLLLMPEERSWLHQRIALRFEQMLVGGFIEEVEALLRKWSLTLDYPSMRSVGYRQVYQYLQGDDDYATLSAKGIASTRQLAKRQLTWLRHWPDAHVFVAENPASISAIKVIMQQVLDSFISRSKS